MTTCWKCGHSCNPYRISETRLDSKRGPCHRICPRRKKEPKRRTYQLNPPRKRGWQAARKAAIRYSCEVSQVALWEHQRDLPPAVQKYIGVVDHIVPERYCLVAKVYPHDPVNLICISPSVHGKKRAAEDAFLKRGDVLKFHSELLKQGWDAERVEAAMRYAGLKVPGGTN